MKVSNDAEFAEYAANNYILDEKSTDVAENDESSGYFSDEELQEDEKDEVMDDDFLKLLNQNILEEDTARKQPRTEEENHNAHQLPFTPAAGHWQGNEAQDCHDDREYYQTFEVDEEHNNTSATPEKKHLKSEDEVLESPDVTYLSHYLTYPPAPEKVDDVEDDLPTDVWDASWVRDATLDERKKSRHTERFDLYSIAEEWERLRQLDRQIDNANCLCCRLCCDHCSSTGTMGIIIPNSQYEHRLRYSTDWYSSDFIAGFAALVSHDAHITTPNYKTSDRVLLVYTPYPNKPVNEILPYGSTTHFVSVVWNKQQHAVLYYDIEKRSVTVFDGLNMDIRKWKDHIIHTVKTYGLKPLISSASCEFRNNVYDDDCIMKRTTLERRHMVFVISFDDSKDPWQVKNDQSYMQGDGVSCGPIACLKVLEIYGYLQVGSIETIGESASGYRPVVMDYYNDCVSRYDDVLKVPIRIKTF